MAIQTSDLLLRLDPAGMMGGSPTRDNSSMERQRLKLMREQFEETKRQNEQDNLYRQQALEGAMARERLGLQKQREQQEAEKAAVTETRRLAAQAKFGELNAAGDIEGARAMIPAMTALGMGVELEGEDGGLPRYRIDMDAAASQKAEGARAAQAAPYGAGETSEQSLSRLGALGYPEDEAGNLDAPVGISSTDEVGPEGLTVAERVASTYGEPGEKTPMAPPTAPDYTGAVPKNVIDMGAIQGQTLARLDPAMSGIIAGLPEEYQQSARSTAAGIRGMGLPAEKALKAFGDFQGEANRAVKGELDRGDERAKAAREYAKQEYAARMGADKEGFDRYEVGYKTIAKEVAGTYGVESRLRTRGLNEQAMNILTNGTKEDDYLVLSHISRSFGERGATTEGDVARALGLPATSTWDQITGWLSSRLEGGIPEPNKKALVGVLNRANKSNDGELQTFSDRLLELADDPETDRDVSRGIRDYWRATVPKSMRVGREKAAGARSTGADAGTETGAVVIPDSARIAKVHNNPGNLKFVGQDGATEGEPAEDGGSWAKFDSPEAGLEALRAQIELDASRGQTLREFVTKYAPPGSNDTETYIAQAAKELRASPDDPLSAVDTYDVLRFVAKKESGTELADQYSEPPGEAAEGEAAISADADARRARLAELRKKYGRTP